MSNPTIQPKNAVIVARDTGDALEVILRTDDFKQACLVFLEEWEKDRRVCMVDYPPSVIIAACALRAHRDAESNKRAWEKRW